jgi:uncharacterized GH25 family protein
MKLFTMKRWLCSLLLISISAVTANAHFVFVVPSSGGTTASVVLSEDLKPDPAVDVTLVGGAALSIREALRGHETALSLSKGDHEYTTSLFGSGVRVVHGDVDLGTMKAGGKTYLLMYHPKTILGDAFTPGIRQAAAPVELVPVREGANIVLQLLAKGQPQSNQEVTVILPGGSQHKLTTDARGNARLPAAQGRIGAWARYWEPTKGERGGATYDEVRHYATLVFDTIEPGGAAARRTATMPEAASSFGAVASDGWLYIYGGHVARTHNYSVESVSGRFSRMNLTDGRWERLPDGPALQGLNLAAHKGKIYRVGGMQPQNKPGEPQDLRSVADVARFDPATMQWETLPSLPTPRSSHDVVVIGDTLFVVGGWTLEGKKPAIWPGQMDVLDLSARELRWQTHPQPFKRRAFIAATLDERLYVIGGFDERSRVVQGVDIYDVARREWSRGPDLPGDAMNGFGPAAASLNANLYVSLDDGRVFRLDQDGKSWSAVGQATPRIVHRLVPAENRLLIVGGAAKGTNLDLIESLEIGKP